MTSTINVADVERWASALGGAALTAYGIKQLKDRSPAGAALTAAGGALMFRGATGHCPMYAAAGINTADDREGTREALGGARGDSRGRGRHDQRHGRPALPFWRKFEKLPRFMDHLVSVQQLDERRSHWVAKAPGRPNGRVGRRDHQREFPDELIGWRTLDRRRRDQRRLGALHSGGPRTAAPRCTCACSTTRLPERSARRSPGCSGTTRTQTIREDLRRFKQLMETGEIADHRRAAARQAIHSELRLNGATVQ